MVDVLLPVKHAQPEEKQRPLPAEHIDFANKLLVDRGLEPLPSEPQPDRDPGRADLTDVHAELFVERPSQKAIVLGVRGARLKQVGTTARKHIEALLGTKVYLDLHVKVAKDWQRDPKQLRRLGF